MTPTRHYKMSRAAKTVLARNWDRKNLSAIRRAIIDGELAAKVVIKSKRDRD